MMTSKALGLIEAVGFPVAIEAADAALKAANVTLIGYDLTRGGGMITVKVVGDVGAVNAAVSAGVAAAQRIGKIAACHVIPRPHAEVESLILQITRPKSQPAPATPAKPVAVSKPAAPKPPKPQTKKSEKPARPPKAQVSKPAEVTPLPPPASQPEAIEPAPPPPPPPPAPEPPASEGEQGQA